MESALYGIHALVVFVSENSCVNTVRAHFPWSNLYIQSSNNWGRVINKNNCQCFCISENDGETFTLSEAVEAIGMGKFQILLILMAGFVNVSMGLKQVQQSLESNYMYPLMILGDFISNSF